MKKCPKNKHFHTYAECAACDSQCDIFIEGIRKDTANVLKELLAYLRKGYMMEVVFMEKGKTKAQFLAIKSSKLVKILDKPDPSVECDCIVEVGAVYQLSLKLVRSKEIDLESIITGAASFEISGPPFKEALMISGDNIEAFNADDKLNLERVYDILKSDFIVPKAYYQAKYVFEKKGEGIEQITNGKRTSNKTVLGENGGTKKR